MSGGGGGGKRRPPRHGVGKRRPNRSSSHRWVHALEDQQQQQHSYVDIPAGNSSSSSGSGSGSDADRHHADADEPYYKRQVRSVRVLPSRYQYVDTICATQISWINVVDGLASVGFIIFLLWTNPSPTSIPSMFLLLLLFHVGIITGRLIQGIVVLVLVLAVDIIILALYIWYWQTDVAWASQPIAKIIFISILLLCTILRFAFTLTSCCRRHTNNNNRDEDDNDAASLL